MKYRKISQVAFFIIALILFPHAARAETSSDVSVSNNTICRNGECTTTSSGGGESKVCVNGKCFTGENGNVDYKSEDGNTTVRINNANNTITQSPKTKITGTISPKVHQQKKDELKKKIYEQKKKIKEERNVLEDLFDNLKNLLKSLRLS